MGAFIVSITITIVVFLQTAWNKFAPVVSVDISGIMEHALDNAPSVHFLMDKQAHVQNVVKDVKTVLLNSNAIVVTLIQHLLKYFI